MTKKKLLSVLKLIPAILWWGLLLATAVLIVVFLSAHFRGEVPRLFGYSVLHIVSDSMEPTIERDSYILIERADPAEVGYDDIICFYSTDPGIYGCPNTHRVIKDPIVEGEVYRYVTKGDKCPAEDTHLAEGERLIGIFVKALPGFTAMMRFVTEYFIVLFAGLFALGAVAAFVPLFLKKEKTDTKQ